MTDFKIGEKFKPEFSEEVWEIVAIITTIKIEAHKSYVKNSSDVSLSVEILEKKYDMLSTKKGYSKYWSEDTLKRSIKVIK
jgi:hypothetical protein